MSHSGRGRYTQHGLGGMSWFSGLWMHCRRCPGTSEVGYYIGGGKGSVSSILVGGECSKVVFVRAHIATLREN
eukprot:SAG31_NODE_599_length_13649_cov_9.930775_14_plen_73_part_00